MNMPQPSALPESFEIVTERLRLCLHAPALAEAVSDFFLKNHDHLAPFSPRREPGFHSVEAWRQRAAELRQASLSGQALQLLVLRRDEASPRVVGSLNVTHIVRGAFQAGYLGYQLDQEQIGRGLMQEALVASIAHLFGPGGLHRLMANYMPGNERSARLLARLGFRVEGYARNYLFIDGTWKDHVLTALTNPAFAASG